MQVIRERLPKLSEITAVFSVSIVLIHLRAYIITFHAVPAYLKRMPFWDMLGIMAYVQIVALIEALLFLLFTIFINVTLPKRFFREKFTTQGGIFIAITFLWIIPLHYQNNIVKSLYGNYVKYYILVAVWILTYFLTLGSLSVLSRRISAIEVGIQTIIERTQLLAWIYLVMDLIYFIVITIRVST